MELKGELQNFALPDVIQLLCMSKSTGRLTLGEKHEQCAIYFREGEIIHATEGRLTGEGAVYRLFLRNDGSFEFFAGVGSPLQSVRQSWMNLMLEAARRADEQGAGVSKAALDGLLQPPRPLEPPRRDFAQVKTQLKKIVVANFGNKAKKIEQKIDETKASEIELLSLCDKVEKYIQVFIDGATAKKVADRMRDVVLGIDSGA